MKNKYNFIQKQIFSVSDQCFCDNLAAIFTGSLSFWKTLSVIQSSINNRNYYQFQLCLS